MTSPLDLYDYDLPQGQIAQFPLEQRDQSRLMILRRGQDGCRHERFPALSSMLPEDALLVVNNTRVQPRKLRGKLPSGVAVEALLTEPEGEARWRAQIRKARRVRPGMEILFADGAIPARALHRDPEGQWVLAFSEPETLFERLDQHGLAPLPPYIQRNGQSRQEISKDRESYQTCYASVGGAMAAPTAGLHFTPRIMADLAARGLSPVEITLHVGRGTFSPIKVEDPEQHTMHREWYEVSRDVAEKIHQAKQAGRPVIAVGTTTVRALESWALAGYPEAGNGWSDLFIRPPFQFRVVDGLITNFHQPRSTLLMMVSAFHGRERLLAGYREAVLSGYRFFSFGDCMVILPGTPAG